MEIEELRSRVSGLDNRLLEDELYRFVWNEIESNKLDPVAKVRALADGGSNEIELKSAYIRHRIISLKDQLDALQRKSAKNKADEKDRIRDAKAEVRREEKAKVRAEIGGFITSLFRFIFFGFISFMLVGGMFVMLTLSISDSLLAKGIVVFLPLAFVGWLILWGLLVWKLPFPPENGPDVPFE
jgi:hypothetical protein